MVTVSPASPVPRSVVALPPLNAGTPGAVVSMVNASALEAALTLPAASVALTVMLWVPFPSVGVRDQVPSAVAAVVPSTVVPSYTVTVLSASAVPARLGVVILVMLSVLETPVSEVAKRSGSAGRAGAVASMVIDNAADAAVTLPATSVALVVMTWTPFPIDDVVTVQFPFASAMPVPTLFVPL